MRRCIDCGTDISYRGSSAKRCEACARKRDNKRRIQSRNGTLNILRGRKMLTPKQCEKCIYCHAYGFCDYADMTGHTRLGLHKDENVDINRPCREREVKQT